MAEIHFATKKQYAELVAYNPSIDRVHLLDDNLRPLIRALKRERFDAIIDLHHNLRTFLIKLALRGIPTWSFHKINIEKWLAVRLKWNRLPDKHIVDRYIEAGSFLGIENDHQGLDFYFPQAGKMDEPLVPEKHRDGCYLLVAGAKQNTKKIPFEKMAAIIRETDLPVAIIGGKEEKGIGKKLALMFGNLVWNTCGLLSIHQSAAIIRQAKVVVTPDTGFMHIACALRKPVISVWGNTVPEFGMYPYFGQAGIPHAFSHIIEQKKLPCRPCTKLGYKTCPKNHFLCMQMADEMEISGLVKTYF